MNIVFFFFSTSPALAPSVRRFWPKWHLPLHGLILQKTLSLILFDPNSNPWLASAKLWLAFWCGGVKKFYLNSGHVRVIFMDTQTVTFYLGEREIFSGTFLLSDFLLFPPPFHAYDTMVRRLQSYYVIAYLYCIALHPLSSTVSWDYLEVSEWHLLLTTRRHLNNILHEYQTKHSQ